MMVANKKYPMFMGVFLLSVVAFLVLYLNIPTLIHCDVDGNFDIYTKQSAIDKYVFANLKTNGISHIVYETGETKDITQPFAEWDTKNCYVVE